MFHGRQLAIQGSCEIFGFPDLQFVLFEHTGYDHVSFVLLVFSSTLSLVEGISAILTPDFAGFYMQLFGECELRLLHGR